MTTTVKIEKIGDKFVLPLSEEMLEKLGVLNGGEIEAIDFEDHIELRAAQNGNARRKLIEKYTKEIFDEHREVLQALAEGAK